MWWLLPLLGAVGGALTNLNHPDQMFKNAMIGGAIGGLGNLIPGASTKAGNLLGIGSTSTLEPTTATGATSFTKLPELTPREMHLTSPVINSFLDSSQLTPPPTFFDKLGAGVSKLPIGSIGLGMMTGQPQQPQQQQRNFNLQMPPQMLSYGEQQNQMPTYAGINPYSTTFNSPLSRYFLSNRLGGRY